MLKTEQIKKFLSNDFEQITLYGERTKYLDLKIFVGNINRNDNNEIEIPFNQKISSYSENLEKLKRYPEELCDYLLDNFLTSNTILKVKYYVYNNRYPSKTSIVITGVKRTLTLVFDELELIQIFPNLEERLEMAKKEGILRYLRESKNDLNKRIRLISDTTNQSGLEKSGSYTVLNYKKRKKLLMLPNQDKFVKIWFEQLIELSDCLSDSVEDLIIEIDKKIEELDNSKFVRIKLGNITFESSNIEDLVYLKEVIKSMMVCNEDNKQLMIRM